jgi:hypothetical protein
MKSLFVFWFCLLVSDDPVNYLKEDQVDLIEINHYYDTNGKPVLNQLIFHEWNENSRQFEICDYKLLRSDNHLPLRGLPGQVPYCIWHDDQNLRKVRGRHTIETWTQYDPENRQRKKVPAEIRRGLLRD